MCPRSLLLTLCVLGTSAASTREIDFRDPRVVASAFKSVVEEIKQLKRSDEEDARRGTSGMRFASGSQQLGARERKGGSSSSSKGGEPGDPVDFPPKGVGEKPKGDGKFVPWGKHIPRKASVNYYVSTGEQECKLCRRIIRNAEDAGRSMYTLCNAEYEEYWDMCHAQQKVLQGCPEFSNTWVYACCLHGAKRKPWTNVWTA